MTLQVTYSLFRKIFLEEFNIGFCGPAVDTCAFCDRVSDAIKYERKLRNLNKVRDLKRELKSHKFRARFFFTLMKSSPADSLTFCFDLQQVHYLPKLTLGDTFYKRQLAYYTFCVTDYNIKAPYFYSWIETEGKRGSEEVSSALIHYLNAHKGTWPETTRKIRLFCDGCAGQNKNQIVMHSLAFWLAKQAPPRIDKVHVFFPVRGHSFLPADRLFGIVENKLKTHREIFLPDGFADVYSQYGTVRKLNIDWNVRNYKILNESMKPFTGIKDCKKVILKRKGEVGHWDTQVRKSLQISYNVVDKSKKYAAVTKPKVKICDLRIPKILDAPIPLDVIKQKDIESLLRIRLGNDWPNHEIYGQFYRSLLLKCSEEEEEEEAANSEEEDEPDSDIEERCQCLVEDGCLH